MNAFFDRLAVWTVEKRWGVVLLLAVITVVAAVGHKDPQLLLSLFKKVEPQPEESSGSGTNDKQRVRVPDVDPFSLSRADAVIVVDCDDFFTPAGAQAMRQVVDDLEALDQVRRILWMDRVPILNIFGLPEPLFPRSESSQARFDDARKKALAHPLVAGQLLSLDAKTLLLLVSFDDRFLFEDADATTRLRETAEATAARFPDVRIRFQVTGRVPATIAAIEAHESNQTKFQLIGYGVILLMTIILFRGISAVVIVALAPALGVFWTLGMVRFLEYANNPLVDVILPILVSLVGLTDGVHLMVQIRKLRAAGHSEREAASQGLRQVGMACFLTSLTTAIGFGSLVVADSEWVWQFGVCSAIGVAVCFVAVVTVIPLLCASRLGRNIHVGYEDSLVDRHLSRVGVLVDVPYRHRRLLSLAAIGLTGLLFAVSMTLQPDQRQTDGLPQAAEATRALIHMDQALGGLEFSNVEVNWSDEVPSDSAEVLVAISEVDDLLKTEPLIGHPLSIRSLLDALPGSGPPGERMSMLELLPPPLKRAFFTPERRQAKVTFRVQDLGIAQYGPVFERIEAGLEKIHQQHPAFEFELEGAAVWRWRHLYQIVVDLATSLGTAAVIIFFVLTVVYRSIRIGLISVIPNMFPLVFTGAYLAMAGYNLEIVMVCSFTVCLGIAVDDTIHFLTRFQEERREFDQEQAICRAFTGVGTAMIMTTTVLVVGFSTVILSDSRDHRIFATMGVLTIGTALFGDLIFLPALLGQFAERKVARLPTESDDGSESPPDRENPG
jgi:uncharacterized protein